jgi:hypothetical protein
MVSNVELFAQLAKQGGLNIEQYAIQVFTFVPDSSGYVVVMHKGDRSLTQCAWHNVPAGLDQLLGREAANGVRHVAVGINGSYVVILNSGVVWWKGVPPALNRLLTDAEQKRRGVQVIVATFFCEVEPGVDAPIVPQTVSLSLVAADWFFIEFADGATQFVLPPQWHGTINKHASLSVHKPGPTVVTSFASTPSSTPSATRSAPSSHASRFGSHSMSPLSPHNPSPVHGHTPHLGHTPNQAHTPYHAYAPHQAQAPPQAHTPYHVHISPQAHTPHQTHMPYQAHTSYQTQTPYTPNPYAQTYAGVPQFVPQPPPPQQQQQQQPQQQYQPAVHVTNVYNTFQEPQKPSNNSSGTVQLIGGALKVAAAVLPTLLGTNSGNGLFS